MLGAPHSMRAGSHSTGRRRHTLFARLRSVRPSARPCCSHSNLFGRLVRFGECSKCNLPLILNERSAGVEGVISPTTKLHNSELQNEGWRASVANESPPSSAVSLVDGICWSSY